MLPKNDAFGNMMHSKWSFTLSSLAGFLFDGQNLFPKLSQSKEKILLSYTCVLTDSTTDKWNYCLPYTNFHTWRLISFQLFPDTCGHTGQSSCKFDYQ